MTEAHLPNVTVGKIQFARILDLCVAPELHGLRDSGEESRFEFDIEEEVISCIFISEEEC